MRVQSLELGCMHMNALVAIYVIVSMFFFCICGCVSCVCISLSFLVCLYSCVHCCIYDFVLCFVFECLCAHICVLQRHHFNFSIWWCFRPYKLYIFRKLLVPGYLNWYSQVSYTQIHEYIYTNTQIQHMTKCQKGPTCGIFLKRGLFKDIRNDVPIDQMQKYKHKYSIYKILLTP